MGKKREPHTGQVLSGQPTSATDMPPPSSPPPPPSHSPPPPPLPDNSTRPPRRTLISTTSTLVELISPTHSEQGEDSPSKDQLFNDADEQLCVPDSVSQSMALPTLNYYFPLMQSARQLWEGSPDFEIYSKLERVYYKKTASEYCIIFFHSLTAWVEQQLLMMLTVPLLHQLMNYIIHFLIRNTEKLLGVKLGES